MNILQMSISAGLLIVAVVIIRALALNRLPKIMFLVLWGVAIIRLLIPFSNPLSIGVNNIIEVDYITPISTVYFMEAPEITGMPSSPQISPAPGIMEQPIEKSWVWLFNIAPAKVVWFLGILTGFIFLTVIYYKNLKTLSFATAINDNGFLNNWLRSNKLIRPIAIMQSDRIISPLAVGLFKPKIILPKSIDLSDKQLLCYTLAHEYLHIKRFDTLWKMLLLLTLCLHWFNPLMWVMFVLASRDLEITCDEAVIYHFGAEIKKAYAYMLVGMAEQKGRFAPLYSGFSKNAIQERIVSVMKIKKKSIISMALAVVLVVTLSIGTILVFASGNQSGEYKIPELNVRVDSSRSHGALGANAMSPEEAAQIGARYIWDMIGECMDGMYFVMTDVDNQPFPLTGTRVHWRGEVYLPGDYWELDWMGRSKYYLVMFEIDAETGERISIFISIDDPVKKNQQANVRDESFDWDFWGETRRKILSGELPSRMPEPFSKYEDLARKYAERHFIHTTVEKVEFDSSIYASINPVIFEWDEDGNITIIDQLFEFWVTDCTGREAVVTIYEKSGKLNHLDTAYNDYVPEERMFYGKAARDQLDYRGRPPQNWFE